MHNVFLRGSIKSFIIGLACSASLITQANSLEAALPVPPPPFMGNLTPKAEDSDIYQLPSPAEAPEDAPNVLLIMTDDVGFGAVSTFGGATPKPNLDKLARQGLRFSRFHTTGVCGPTRAALLTGRNHHSVGTGHLAEMRSPYPGYTGSIAPTAATIARILRDNGYSTAMFGKDHNIPMEYRTPAGPFDQWPTGRGFEYFYGWIHGDVNQFTPILYEGTTPLKLESNDPNYIFDKDLTDQTIRWIHTQKAAAPNKPFFIYQALGTAHAPQQAPEEWIAKFRGKFDHGWDEERKRTLQRQKDLGLVPEDTQLAPRPAQIPAWHTLTDTEKKVFARFMEVYAAMLAHQDYQMGRLLAELERMGLAENTLIIYIEGDNGAALETGLYGSINELPDITSPTMKLNYDMEWLADNLDIIGGPNSYAAIPAGWSIAMNTPLPWTKQMASHLGGVRNGLVISWPKHIQDTNSIRSQFHHVTDVVPTILEATGIQAPSTVDGIAQQPIEGTSMIYALNDSAASEQKSTQYFELFANRAIYHEGWWANTTPRDLPWNISRAKKGSDVSSYEWELYNLNDDFSQSTNIADKYPEQLKRMQALFDQEARRHQVYPLQNSGALARMQAMNQRSKPRTEFTYWGPSIQIPFGGGAPTMFWMPFTLTAEIEIPQDGAEGVIFAAGSSFGGWAFYIKEGRPHVAAAHSPLPGGEHKVSAADALLPGKHTLTYQVVWKGEGASVEIDADGKQIAKALIDKRPLTPAGAGEFFETGRDSHVQVSSDYEQGGQFSGIIHKVTIDIQLPQHRSTH